MEWELNSLVSCWEWVSPPTRREGGRVVSDPPAWTQVVKDASGVSNHYGPQGDEQGSAFYENGRSDRGVH